MPDMPFLQRPAFLQQTLHSFIFKRLPGILLGLVIGFGIVFVAHGAEPEACAFGLLQCDENGVVWDLAAASGEDNAAQIGRNEGLAEAIIKVGYFLARQILPLLIGLAFFIFLYFLARSFVIDAASTDTREEARKRALWGFTAFILIASLWGIVNIFVNSLGIDQERSICPDYLDGFCGNLGINRGSSGYNGGGSNLNFGNPSDWGAGDGRGAVSGDDGDVAQPNNSMAELLFGEYSDQINFNFRSGAPRSSGSAISISETSSCEAGFTALQTAARIESLQSGYILHTTSGGTRWLNVTDNTAQTSLDIDAEWLLDNTDTNAPLAVVHSHPQQTIRDVGVSSSGHPPSVSDFQIMCDDVVNEADFVTVDQNNLWVVEASGVLCPRRSPAREALPVVSTLLHLALISPNQRNTAFEEVYTWPDLSNTMRSDLNQYTDTNFNGMSQSAIINMADTLARQHSMSVTRQTPSDYCSSF